MTPDRATEGEPPSRPNEVASAASVACAAGRGAATKDMPAHPAGLVDAERSRVDAASDGIDRVERGASCDVSAEAEANAELRDDAQSLAAAIHEGVTLHAPDPAWAGAFEIERDRLLAVAPGVFIQIEHIGSTAVPGLAAKPIIDILAGVASLDGVDVLVDRLCEQGYTTSKEFNATLIDRRWLMRWKNCRRTHHLHVVAYGGTP
jgi:hypothetical protein